MQQREAPLTQRQEADLSDLILTHIAPRLERTSARTTALRDAARFGSIFTDQDGRTRSYASLLPAALKHCEQLDAEELPGYTARALTRLALADKIEREVLPISTERWFERYPMRLRVARRSGAYGIEVATGRPVVFWDKKAGLSRLCPDDAREEAMRIARRYQPTLEDWPKCSRTHRLTYMVLTQRNSAPGKLRQGMEKIFRDFRRLLKSGEFPSIKGALAVLEAPLGAARDWNVHLNVLVMHDGFVNWGKLRHLWHWNVHMEQLSRAPGSIGAALRELIKYAVAATVTKSAEKVNGEPPDTTGDRRGAPTPVAGDARGDGAVHRERAPDGAAIGHRGGKAPPMLEWTNLELREWLLAFHGFRRTRSYGALYDLERPAPEPLGLVAWLGRVLWQGGRYLHHLDLLDSIQEDKSALDQGPQDPRTTWQRFRHRLKLDHLEPIGELAVTLNDIYAAIEQHPLMREGSL